MVDAYPLLTATLTFASLEDELLSTMLTFRLSAVVEQGITLPLGERVFLDISLVVVERCRISRIWYQGFSQQLEVKLYGWDNWIYRNIMNGNMQISVDWVSDKYGRLNTLCILYMCVYVCVGITVHQLNPE